MGAGILPVTVIDGKIYFLFGKENKYADTPGWSDFGGGTETKESFMNTAIREAGEEVTGFLGDSADIKKMLTKYGTINIDNPSINNSVYRMHIFPMVYNPFLPLYYNNNQKFLQRRLDANVIKNSTIFEKSEIKWVCIDELEEMKPQFRYYFVDIVDKILSKQKEIDAFARRALQPSRKSSRKTRRARK